MTDYKQIFFRVAGFLALFASGGMIGFFLAKNLTNPTVSSEFPPEYKLFALPIIIFILFLTIAVHEAGHLIGGLSVGFDFSVFIVGPFMLVRENDKIKFKWNKGLGFFGGLASCMPKNTQNLMKRFLALVAGGPFASLILTLVSFGIIWFYNLASQENTLKGFLTSFTFHSLAWVSLGIFIIACIPMKSAGFYTDGARILNLLRGGNLAKLDTLLMTTLTQSSTGTRPRELSLPMLEEAVSLPVKSVFQVYARLYLYYAMLDTGEPDKAQKHLTAAFEDKKLLPKFFDGVLQLEKAFFEAVFKKNTQQARQDFEQVKQNNFIPVHTYLRAKTAVLMAENQTEEAWQTVAEALKFIHKAADKGVAIWEKEWLESVLISK